MRLHMPRSIDSILYARSLLSFQSWCTSQVDLVATLSVTCYNRGEVSNCAIASTGLFARAATEEPILHYDLHCTRAFRGVVVGSIFLKWGVLLDA